MTSEDLNLLISNSKRFGCDYHGTLDSGKFVPPENTVIITGAPIEEEERIKEEIETLGFKDKIKDLIFNETDDLSPRAVGEFKARKIKELGLDLYFDNDPSQIYWIKKFNPQANVVYINSLNYAIFTYGFECLGYALRLVEEGNSVVIGLLTAEEAGEKIKNVELEKRRKEIGSGLLKVIPAKKLFDFLIKNDKIDDYFVDFDFNYGCQFAEQLEKKGYAGLFPHQEDREMEVDRQKAQDFVRQNYPELFIPDEEEFNKIDDAIKFFEEKKDIFVIKPNTDSIYTFVPIAEEPEQFIEEAKAFLEKNKNDLEKDGFIVQKKISQPCEATPETIYYKGVPIAFSVDIELKKIGAGDVGYQTGCSADFVFPIRSDSKIARIALEPYFPFAKQRGFSNFMDASLLIDRKKDIPYFGEFCAARRGYNSFYTELALCPSVSHFFECIKEGKNPFIDSMFPFEEPPKRFAFSVRIFNLNTDKDRYPQAGLPIQIDVEKSKDIWVEDAKIENGKLVTAGYSADTVIVTGSGNDIIEAIENLKNNISGLILKDMFWRNDIECNEWYGILNRYQYLLGKDYL